METHLHTVLMLTDFGVCVSVCVAPLIVCMCVCVCVCVCVCTECSNLPEGDSIGPHIRIGSELSCHY